MILLHRPDIKLQPLLTWHDWTDTVTCVHIGHLVTQAVLHTTSWIPLPHCHLRIQTFHYLTACAINIVCLSSRQMETVVLLTIVAQLPIVFSTTNSVLCKSLCSCVWTTNWIVWIITQIICYFVIPGIFLIHPLVVEGLPQELSTAATTALFWAISYFGIFFLWELHRPIKAFKKECENEQDNYRGNDQMQIVHSERTPLVNTDQVTNIHKDLSIP